MSLPVKLDAKKYPNLAKYTKELHPAERPVLGREHEIREIKATLRRNEVSNVMLLADAGTGKTATVEGLVKEDNTRSYLSVDLSLMSSSEGSNTDGSVEMASRMKHLVDEVEEFQQETNQELVLFMDEFHLIMQVSKAAAQAIKPLLAESGRRHIRIIAATTLEEFDQYIRDDEALTERLQRINLTPPSDDVVVSILRSMQRQYAPKAHVSDELLKQIVEYTNRFLPAQAQPRKSLLVFDSMLGWYNAYGKPLNFDLLQQVMMESSGINIRWSVDVPRLKSYLNGRVFDQSLAVNALIGRLYMSVADLNDPTRPQASLLFTGSTGTGKTEMAKALTKAMFGDENRMIRFDMTEYAQANTVDRLRDRLTSEIWAHPFSVLLLDEIEKANQACTRLLLQLLDDGRLTDKHGRVTTFRNCYVVITTNAGAEIYKTVQSYLDEDRKNTHGQQIDEGDELMSYMPLIRQSLTDDRAFPPELIGRLDAIVPFSPLRDETLKKIARLRLEEFAHALREKHEVELVVDKEVINYLTLEGLSTDANAGGGRMLKRKIDDEIISPVSKFILSYPDVRQVAVKVAGTEAWRDKRLVKSDAHLVVGRYQPNRRRKSVR